MMVLQTTQQHKEINMAAKRAYQAKQGMQLAPSAIDKDNQEIWLVSIVEGRIMVNTSQGDFIFSPSDLMAFPRREDGTTKIHGLVDSHILINDIVSGDVIPPSNIWPELPAVDEIDFMAAGYVVSSVSFSRTGTVFSLQPIAGGLTVELFQARNATYLYEFGAVFIQPGTSYKQEKSGFQTNASGYYKNIFTKESTRFRIAGSRGRPPKGSQPAPVEREEWDEWRLLEDETKHPLDPRE